MFEKSQPEHHILLSGEIAKQKQVHDGAAATDQKQLHHHHRPKTVRSTSLLARLVKRELSDTLSERVSCVNVHIGLRSFLATMTIITTRRVYHVGQDMAR